jgi:hypothetical protein
LREEHRRAQVGAVDLVEGLLVDVFERCSRCRPMQLTRMSMRGSAATVSRIAATSSTSSSIPRAPRPSFFANDAAFFASRPATMTRAPARTRPRQIAPPIAP